MMTDTTPTQVAALEAFLQDHPTIKFTAPTSPDYPAAREVWNGGRLDNPLAVVQPQTPTGVSTIVKYAKAHKIPFTIRAGGHNLEGRSIVEGALLIDLRALTDVTVSSDRQSATVQGGILQKELATKLWEEGLATPMGTIPGVGYVGWATYGGYGPFSAHWGLGVDQIISATVVSPDGDIVTADETLLKGIRGGGGLFGVILDLTIKVYPLKSLLTGAIVFNSQDIIKTVTDFNAAYEELLDTGIPPELYIQQISFNTPHGRVYAVLFVWSSDDTEEGLRWSEKIASLGPVIMNNVAPTGIPGWLTANGAFVPSKMFGISRTQNIRRITPEVAKVLGQTLDRMPSDPGTMFSIQQLRGVSAEAKSNSVFATREPHLVLEILGFTTEDEAKEESEQWAKRAAEEFQQTDPNNTLPTVYISLLNTMGVESADVLRKAYGPHVPELLALKERIDPENVYSLAVPLLR
ncbi:FAD-binding domain-containing protein [Aspergillus heteromorphus CBS 117.55]|uniref:FAD-binding domain-containing protein n=1 Tax=Aspergillus heteromorphus CBS 117.55 TaxID=1448321 RepID=A0A317X5D6_9EURO|nr:FAD-binding domain-containing protein [Aspergillus heteromorphus CBS 117.55]PWY92832.1 FAD-binding domain-containing protein [Aspergillus heteromorphus CBS 117.55]